jgi:prophage antirepressor-like protein
MNKNFYENMGRQTIALYYGKYALRGFTEGGELWLAAKDVAHSLEYPEGSNASRLFDFIPDAWKGVNETQTKGGMQQLLCISENGICFFLGRSKKTAVDAFQKWFIQEALPSIRKSERDRRTQERTTMREIHESLLGVQQMLARSRERFAKGVNAATSGAAQRG